MENLQIERIIKQVNKESENIFQKLYSRHIIKGEYEFGVRTNELIYCDKGNKPKGYCFPDFLLKVDDTMIIAEITTAHDLDHPNALDRFHPGTTKVVSGGITGKIGARINSKMTEKNFKNIDDFHLPIIFVVFNNNNSSFIDKEQIDIFLNDSKNYSPEQQKMLLSLPPENDSWVIEKIPKHTLISGILFVNSVSGRNQIKYFPHDSSKNKLSQEAIKTLEN